MDIPFFCEMPIVDDKADLSEGEAGATESEEEDEPAATAASESAGASADEDCDSLALLLDDAQAQLDRCLNSAIRVCAELRRTGANGSGLQVWFRRACEREERVIRAARQWPACARSCPS
mmetsp:Transcript_137562/g.427327  ORF Transcript_137562/g.427327 Transcript_137562/m.427327 type:complete len:120 (-) Transcript_137562:245-604(-)